MLEGLGVSRTDGGAGRTASSPSRTRRRAPAPTDGPCPARGARDRDIVDVRTVQVEVGQARPDNSASSATEPTHVSWPSVQRQMGSGVPQYRSRDRAQSTLFSSQLPKRPCLMCSGCQPIRSFSRSSASRRSDVRANHEVLAQ